MSDASRRGTAARRKGATGEREVTGLLREYGYDAHRGIQAAGEPDVIGLPGVHIEVKRQNHYDITGWMAQSQRDAKPGELPIVVFRRDREDWKVMLPFDAFMQIYKEWEASTDG